VSRDKGNRPSFRWVGETAAPPGPFDGAFAEAFTRALQAQAAHEQFEAVRLRYWGARLRRLDHRPHPHCLKWAAERDGLARLYSEWAQAIDLEVPVNFIRYGCEPEMLV
jgi:hypothetical protein